MTGAILPPSVDTVIRYEDLEVRAGLASVLVNYSTIKKGQNIHYQGRDKKKDDVVAPSGRLITPAIISLVASVGETELRVTPLISELMTRGVVIGVPELLKEQLLLLSGCKS